MCQFFALLLIGGAGPAAAQDYFGAIAFSPKTRAHGWAYDYTSRTEAQDRAMSECRRHAPDCVSAVWFRNACGALAVGPQAYGAGWGTDRGQAERAALKSCGRYSRDCTVIRWICTTN
jgi:serine/threonine-protein kinase